MQKVALCYTDWAILAPHKYMTTVWKWVISFTTRPLNLQAQMQQQLSSLDSNPDSQAHTPVTTVTFLQWWGEGARADYGSCTTRQSEGSECVAEDAAVRPVLRAMLLLAAPPYISAVAAAGPLPRWSALRLRLPYCRRAPERGLAGVGYRCTVIRHGRCRQHSSQSWGRPKHTGMFWWKVWVVARLWSLSLGVVSCVVMKVLIVWMVHRH
jgi:hypothetical protein